MKYLCLTYDEEHTLNVMSKAERIALRGETLTCLEDLKSRGHLISAGALQSDRTSTTVRVRGGRVSLTDGPFAETNEHLGGYFLINARDLNEAIQVASKWPPARFGSIEVRPVEEEPREENRYL